MDSAPSSEKRTLRVAAPLVFAAITLLGFSDVHAQDNDKFKFSAGIFSVFKHDSAM